MAAYLRISNIGINAIKPPKYQNKLKFNDANNNANNNKKATVIIIKNDIGCCNILFIIIFSLVNKFLLGIKFFIGEICLTVWLYHLNLSKTLILENLSYNYTLFIQKKVFCQIPPNKASIFSFFFLKYNLFR